MCACSGDGYQLRPLHYSEVRVEKLYVEELNQRQVEFELKQDCERIYILQTAQQWLLHHDNVDCL